MNQKILMLIFVCHLMNPCGELLVCMVGEPHAENRHRVWSQLQAMRGASDLPWLVVGDFNEALWQFEHLSHTPWSENQMMAFRDTL
jgi:hypothetical protein